LARIFMASNYPIRGLRRPRGSQIHLYGPFGNNNTRDHDAMTKLGIPLISFE